MIPASDCKHEMLMLGSHESFLRKGWLCTDCGTFVQLGTDLRDNYAVVLTALKMEAKSGFSKSGVDRKGS